MKRTIITLVILAMVSAVLSLYFLQGFHRRNERRISEIASIDGSDSILQRVPKQRSIHWDNPRIYQLSTTPTGQQILCSQIGVEGDGLDEASFRSAVEDLKNQSWVEQDCLTGVLRRLDVVFMEEQLNQEIPKDTPTVRAEEIALLRAHPDETSEIFRNHYGLSGSNPNSELLVLLKALQIQSSCVDIAQSIPRMKKVSNPFASSFDELYTKSCRL